MNERIEKLARQAGFNLIRKNCYDIVSTMSVQEFAELIARECAYVSEGYFGFKNNTPGTSIAKEIREHFGVEE